MKRVDNFLGVLLLYFIFWTISYFIYANSFFFFTSCSLLEMENMCGVYLHKFRHTTPAWDTTRRPFCPFFHSLLLMEFLCFWAYAYFTACLYDFFSPYPRDQLRRIHQPRNSWVLYDAFKKFQSVEHSMGARCGS